jgi:hypothetical protein
LLYTDPTGECLGWLWNSPSCRFAGFDPRHWSWGDAMDTWQGALDVTGLVPGLGEPADALNGVIWMMRGDCTAAALSFAAMVPVAGWAATAGKAGKRAASAIQPNTLTTLRHLAQQAGQTTPIPPGTSAHVAGTLKHTTFRDLVRGLGRSDLKAEVNYLRGRPVPNNQNVSGSVRLDVVEGTLHSPTAIYDFKTGARGLDTARIRQIRSHLPNSGNLPNGNPIPIVEVRP